MTADDDTLPAQLKAAREAAGLNQRAVAAMTGLQQGQLSRIETGAVDPRLSSVIALARALELEPVLVPRRALLAVQAVLGSKTEPGRPAYSLDDEDA